MNIKEEYMKIHVLKHSDVNPDMEQQLAGLFRQLNADLKQIDLRHVLDPENPISLVYCRDGSKVLGMALMCTYTVISGNKGWVEDVVVDKESRGQGIGRKLMEKLVALGKEKGLSEILLFSADKRIEAINLYKSLGFKEKESRIYVLRTEALIKKH